MTDDYNGGGGARRVVSHLERGARLEAGQRCPPEPRSRRRRRDEHGEPRRGHRRRVVSASLVV